MIKLSLKEHDNIINNILSCMDKIDVTRVVNQVIKLEVKVSDELTFEIEGYKVTETVTDKYVVTSLINGKVHDSITICGEFESSKIREDVAYIVNVSAE